MGINECLNGMIEKKGNDWIAGLVDTWSELEGTGYHLKGQEGNLLSPALLLGKRMTAHSLDHNDTVSSTVSISDVHLTLVGDRL